MLINISNHPSTRVWPQEQIDAAHQQFGEIVDLPFPYLPPELEFGDFERMADEYLETIESLKPDAVLLVGEFVFVHLLVNRLLAAGIPVYATRILRNTRELKLAKLMPWRIARYKFTGFMPYGTPAQKDIGE